MAELEQGDRHSTSSRRSISVRRAVLGAVALLAAAGLCVVTPHITPAELHHPDDSATLQQQQQRGLVVSDKARQRAGPRPGGLPLDIGAAFPVGIGSLPKLEDAYGVERGGLDVIIRYQDVNYKLSKKWDQKIGPALDAGKQAVLVLEFWLQDRPYKKRGNDKAGNLGDIASGKYDALIARTADTIIARGNPENLWIRPLHEMNADWYPWGVFNKMGNTVPKFQRAFRRIVDVMRKKDVKAKFQLGFICSTSGGYGNPPFMDFWPGDDYVDMVVCDVYNRAGVSYDEWRPFSRAFKRGYDAMTAIPRDVPLGIGEVGTTDWEGHDKALWIRNAFRELYYDYSRITQVGWFFYNKTWTGSGDWPLKTPKEKKAFADSVFKYGSR